MTDHGPTFSRRVALASLAGGTAAMILARPGAALAFTEAEATALINQAVADINGIINSGKSEAAMFKDFERIFSRYADVPTIARSVLGPPARSASAAQMRNFSAAFQVYISRKYGRRFREFIGGKVEVNSTRAVKSFYEVQCTAILQGEPPFGVTFVVASQSGRFIDMMIEGISLLKAERGEIGSLLDKRRGNVDQLIADLPSLG